MTAIPSFFPTFSALLLCKINVLDIFDTGDFFIQSNFWFRMYVPFVQKEKIYIFIYWRVIFYQFFNNFPALLLCWFSFLDIFNMSDFLNILAALRNIEILTNSYFIRIIHVQIKIKIWVFFFFLQFFIFAAAFVYGCEAGLKIGAIKSGAPAQGQEETN